MCLNKVPIEDFQESINFFYDLNILLILTDFLLLFRNLVMSNSLQPGGLQHARLPCPSLSPGVCSNSCALNQCCHPTISSSVALFSLCLLSFPASGSFPVSQLLYQVAKVSLMLNIMKFGLSYTYIYPNCRFSSKTRRKRRTKTNHLKFCRKK